MLGVLRARTKVARWSWKGRLCAWFCHRWVPRSYCLSGPACRAWCTIGSGSCARFLARLRLTHPARAAGAQLCAPTADDKGQVRESGMSTGGMRYLRSAPETTGRLSRQVKAA
jgi:hypothetical protein